MPGLLYTKHLRKNLKSGLIASAGGSNMENNAEYKRILVGMCLPLSQTN
jgi:hypothetical protein